jgi:hypothetical protein
VTKPKGRIHENVIIYIHSVVPRFVDKQDCNSRLRRSANSESHYYLSAGLANGKEKAPRLGCGITIVQTGLFHQPP